MLALMPYRGQHQRPGKAGSAVFPEGALASPALAVDFKPKRAAAPVPHA